MTEDLYKEVAIDIMTINNPMDYQTALQVVKLLDELGHIDRHNVVEMYGD